MEKYKFQAKSEKDLLEKALEELNVKKKTLLQEHMKKKVDYLVEKNII